MVYTYSAATVYHEAYTASYYGKYCDNFISCSVYREQVIEVGDKDKQHIIDTLCSSPSALEADDIQDFCSLAQYYASKTPQSFRRVSSSIGRSFVSSSKTLSF